jgi:hypothetical protein
MGSPNRHPALGFELKRKRPVRILLASPFRIGDTGFDSGFGIQDSGFGIGIRDSG